MDLTNLPFVTTIDDMKVMEGYDAVIQAFQRACASPLLGVYLFSHVNQRRIWFLNILSVAGFSKRRKVVSTSSTVGAGETRPNLSLATATGHLHKIKGNKIDEEAHMQPTMMILLRAAARAVNSDVVFADTHSSGLLDSSDKPDCVALAGCPEDRAAYPQVVHVEEFKVKDGQTQLDSLMGQAIQRGSAVFASQPKRIRLPVVLFTLVSVEVWIYSHNVVDV